MKHRFLWLLSFLLIMAIIPMFSFFNLQDIFKQIDLNNNATADSAKSSPKQKLYLAVASVYNTKWNNDTIKAAAILANTNLLSEQSGLLKIKTVDELKQQWPNDFDAVYKKIVESADDAGNKKLVFNDEIKYIPYISLSSGETITSQEYPYLQIIASPWDVMMRNAGDIDSKACGVSLSGIDYLISQGANVEDALLWYLPEFDIV